MTQQTVSTLQPQAIYRQDYQPTAYTITDIDLCFELAAQQTTVTAISQVKRQDERANSLTLQGGNMLLLSVQVNGKNWPHYQLQTLSDQQTLLHLSQLPEQFSLQIITQIDPQANTALEGLYQSGEALCTQCEAQGFRHITYYLDRPDVLARFTTKIIADKQRYPLLLSNGNRVEHGELPEGRHWVRWQDPFPKPCYLFALVAGDFDCLTDSFTTRSGRQVALELYVDKGNLNRAHWAMQSLKNAMQWDEQRFGFEYDLDIYMIVAVDFFNMGAMENKGLNIFNAKYVLADTATATDKDYLAIESVIGHEYFHNWTGNRVTCRDWFQLSLKEGLTVFRDQEFSSDLGSRAVNRINNVRIIRGAQFAEDASPMSHPIRPDKVIEMNNFYTLTVYEKGAEVIRMLHTLLGEDNFQAGMRLYIQRFDGQAATCDDFVQAMEDAAQQDLQQFRLWYSQSGTPIFTVQDSYDAQRQQYCLTIKQHTPATADQQQKQPLHIPFAIALYGADGQPLPLITQGQPVDAVLQLRQAEQQFVFEQLAQPPIPAFLTEFSAPVKLRYDYQEQQLIFLMQHAANDFARWDAAQSLLAITIRHNVANQQRQQPLSISRSVIAAFDTILTNKQIDPALAALMLTLPSENEIAELFEQIDPVAIHQVHQWLTKQLAEQLAEHWLAVYQQQRLHDYRIAHADIARRALTNTCLFYLALQPTAANIACVEQHYYLANNMTDAFAALHAAVTAQLPNHAQLLQHFEQRWQHDGLVMDKWFSLQAMQGSDHTLAKVEQLMQHPTFSLANPNRARALIGAFCMNNPYAFHAADGSGYQFLQRIVTTLNQRNPQVAARLIEPLIRWQRYDKPRQQQMRDSLTALAQLDNLSADLYEKISRALAAAV